MAKKVATTKQTSGAGFGFEDKVGAHFAVQMLLGGSPFYPRLGSVSKIELQKRVDRYFLDDLVLTLEHDGHTWECSLSVRSNARFGTTTAPTSFVQALWEMFLHEGTNRFVVDRDMMGLMTGPLSDPPRVALLQDLLPKAREQEPSALAQRLTSEDPDTESYSPNARKLFRSFYCPDPLAKEHTTGPETVAELLKHVVVLEFDFGNHTSSAENWCLNLLQGLLVSGSIKDASTLWHDLLAIVRSVNEAGGYLDRKKLLDEFSNKYEFKARPDYANDWKKLTDWGHETLEGIVVTIGGKVPLARAELVNNVAGCLSSNKLCGVVGSSGTGKSVVSKLAARSLGADVPVLWFGSEEFTAGGFDNLASRLQLQHSFSDILTYMPSQFGVVVLDGLERVASDDAYARIKRLMDTLGLGQQTSSWLVLFSCQAERWEFVQIHLLRIGVDPGSLSIVQVPALKADELGQIHKVFPNLYSILCRPHLQEILTRPKILDIMAAHSQSVDSANSNAWAGESDLIRWFWSSVISSPADGPAREVMLQKLGERQADHGETETPLVDLGGRDAQVLPGLERDGVCRRNDSGRVIFDHDLIGDWCRQRLLIGQEQTLSKYLEERSLNPNWHKAIRLYGLHLLEGQGGVEAWSDARNRLASVEDLLLDSVVLAVNSRDLLEKLWSTLKDANGQMLRRLLGRFLHVATYPDPMAVLLGDKSDQGIAGWLRANMRRPLWTYWLGILSFLYQHTQDVVEIASLEVAQITSIWLQYGGKEWPLRREAAELALSVGEITWRARLDHRSYRQDENDKKKYSAALAAASELPEEVADFALRACARKLTPEIISAKAGRYTAPGSKVRLHSALGSGCERLQPEPWPDGPKYRVDDAFQHCCLFNASLSSLMGTKPSVAKEVILATLIKNRVPEHPEQSLHSHSLRDVELADLHQFTPPLYNKGPFWIFLLVSPQEALDCIIRLVNFATERWAEKANRYGVTSPRLTLLVGSEKRQYVGTLPVCGWYRGESCSYVVASALMALEDWLYKQLEEKKSVDDVCQTILDRGRSCAFLGLLWEIGRFEPDLLKGPLRTLLSCAQLYEWEFYAIQQGPNRLGLIGLWFETEAVKSQIRKWETMEHRSRCIHDFSLHLFLSDETMSDFFNQARQHWMQQRTTLPDADPMRDCLDVLIPKFNRSNWKTVENDNGEKGFQYVPPPELKQKIAKSEDVLKASIPLRLILKSRRILENGASLESGQVDSFFGTLQSLHKDKTARTARSGQRSTAILAGIAVLANKHWSWLSEQSSRYNWCLSVLFKILSCPPEIGKICSEYDYSGLSWEDFAAEAVLPFWARDRTNKKLRSIVADRITAKHYSAVTLLTHAAYKLRDKLCEDFDRLITLVLRWAVLREDTNKSELRQRKPVNVKVQFARHRKAFVKGTIPTEWGDWGTESVKQGEQYPVSSHHSISIGKRNCENTGFVINPRIDREFVRAAFANIFHLNQAGSGTERRKWLAFWSQGLECVLGSHRVCNEAGQVILDGDLETRQYEFDQWFAGRCVRLILEMNSSENPRHIWQKIMDLGPPAHEWIETFFTRWFAYGLDSSCTNRFVAEWKAMFDYACSSPIWRDRQKCRSCWDNFWLHLLGIDQSMTFCWQDAHTPVVEQMSDRFALWFPQNLKDRWIARLFLHWLRCSAAKPLRLPAVPWLTKVARNADDYWWDRENVTELMAEILDGCWRDDRASILADAALLNHFRELVSILVRRQNALAMDLQGRLS